jgi:hypothetical protein
MSCASVNHTQRAKTATDWSAPRVRYEVTKTQNLWHRSVDYKHCFFYVKFEVGFPIPFTRDSMSNKKGDFFIGDGPSIFSKNGGV